MTLPGAALNRTLPVWYSLGPDGDERLFVVTPDPEQPAVVAALGDPRLLWFGFRSVYDAIDRIAHDPALAVTEQSRFLLRELQALLAHDSLVDNDDAVVVAARLAYPEYMESGVYICQPRRAFRSGLTHMAFYAEGAVQPHVPEIPYREDLVTFSRADRPPPPSRRHQARELLRETRCAGPVRPVPNSLELNFSVVPRTFGRCRVTGPAVVFTVTGL
jgi:hypothetical protein